MGTKGTEEQERRGEREVGGLGRGEGNVKEDANNDHILVGEVGRSEEGSRKIEVIQEGG